MFYRWSVSAAEDRGFRSRLLRHPTLNSNGQMNRAMSFLNELRAADIHYRISQHRDDALMVVVAVPGERW